MTENITSTPSPTLGALVGRLVTAIENASPGDAAALRRTDVAEPTCGAFWKLAATHLADRRLSPEDEARWAVLFNVFAHAGSLHRFGFEHSLGRVLARIGFSELRFTRLIRARGDVLLNEAMLLGKLLAAKAEPVDLTGVAVLVLSEDELTRRPLARDFFDTLARNSHAADTAAD